MPRQRIQLRTPSCISDAAIRLQIFYLIAISNWKSKIQGSWYFLPFKWKESCYINSGPINIKLLPYFCALINLILSFLAVFDYGSSNFHEAKGDIYSYIQVL